MKFNIVKILAIISVIILVIGFSIGYSLIKQFDSIPNKKYSVDGSDFSPLIAILLVLAIVAWSSIIGGITVLVIGIIWAIYGLTVLIKKHVSKHKNN